MEMQSRSNGHLGSEKTRAEIEYLRERVRSCERGLSLLHQLLTQQPKEEQNGGTHYRSASLTVRSRSGSCSSPLASPHRTDSRPSDNKQDDGRVVTFPELREAILGVVSERDQLAQELDQYRAIADAAKRERLITMEEKDSLLRESHDLKKALERMSGKLQEVDSERKHLFNKIHDLEHETEMMRVNNDKTIRLYSSVMEERSRLAGENIAMATELASLRDQHSQLLDDLQSTNRLPEILETTPTREVVVPGRKSFGFTWESRVFVSSVEGPASGLLESGDQILQVMGRPAAGMKLSALEKTIKNCKDGLTLTIQRSHDSRRRPSDHNHHYITPGTPGSSVSENSAGYHSLTHSLPSIVSNNISPTDQRGRAYEDQRGRACDSRGCEEPYSLSQATYEDHRYRSGNGHYQSRGRAGSLYGRRSTVGHTPLSPGTHRARGLSQGDVPRGRSLPRTTPTSPRTPVYNQLNRGKQMISASADNLDADSLQHPPTHSSVSRARSHGHHLMGRNTSHDCHVIPRAPGRRPISMSTGSMTHV